jgi:hypothetical protein
LDVSSSPISSVLRHPVLTSFFDTSTFFNNVLNEGPATTVVLHNTCNLPHTYEVRGRIASYVGTGDLHDDRYDAMKLGTTINGFRDYWLDNVGSDVADVNTFPNRAKAFEKLSNETFLKEQGVCLYYLSIYPTVKYEDNTKTFIPITYAFVVIVVFVCLIVLFLLYDSLVERRQRQVVVSAAKSDAMINSLFPAVIRDRLFQSRRRSVRARHHHRTLGNTRIGGLDGPRGDDLTPKSRLTNFLTSSSTVGLSLNAAAYSDDEPIAEMFANTTVVSLERRNVCCCRTMIVLLTSCLFLCSLVIRYLLI